MPFLDCFFTASRTTWMRAPAFLSYTLTSIAISTPRRHARKGGFSAVGASQHVRSQLVYMPVELQGCLLIYIKHTINEIKPKARKVFQHFVQLGGR